MYLVHLKGLKTLTPFWVAILKERFNLGDLRRCGRKEKMNSLNYIDLPLHRVQVKAVFSTVHCNITDISWPARRLLICDTKALLRGIRRLVYFIYSLQFQSELLTPFGSQAIMERQRGGGGN
jgi:hypothetical protein